MYQQVLLVHLLAQPQDAFPLKSILIPRQLLQPRPIRKPSRLTTRIDSASGGFWPSCGQRSTTSSMILAKHSTSKERSRERGSIEPANNITAFRLIISTDTATNNSTFAGRFKHQWAVAARRFRRLARRDFDAARGRHRSKGSARVRLDRPAGRGAQLAY